MAAPQENAIGVIFTLTVTKDGVAADLQGATTKNFIFRKPNGSILTKAALFVTNGADGKLTYATVAGDLTPAGDWQWQADLVTPSYTGRTSVATFIVKPNLAAA